MPAVRSGVAQPESTVRALHFATFWLLAPAAALLMYWLCLRFLQPGYFSPLSPYHIDFYDYAGMRMKAAAVFLRYPRPVSFLSMKLLGYGGLFGTMAGAVSLALLNLVLTAQYVRRLFSLHTLRMLPAVVLYLLLNIAHPSFYLEHRHDLPAQVSYFFLTTGLLAWISWVNLPEPRGFRSARGIGTLLIAILCATAFAFSKETYFVSAAVLLAGLAASDAARRVRHFCFLGFVLALEFGSLLWTRHVNSPFANVSGGADAPYKVSVEPVSVANTFSFYLDHLLNPALVVIALGAIVLAFPNRAAFLRAAAFPLAALGALAPHAVLPNHMFQEYAWAGVPLLLAPILIAGTGMSARPTPLIQVIALAVASVVAVAGPGGYTSEYGSAEMTWVKGQDRYSSSIVRSFEALRALPPKSRVLIAGLDDPSVPWQYVDFIRAEFGESKLWTVVFPPRVQFRHQGTLSRFLDPANVQMTDFDHIAIYETTGELKEIRAIDNTSGPKKLPASVIPRLATLAHSADVMPPNPAALLDAAAAALDWGFGADAVQLLSRATKSGGVQDSRYHELFTRAEGMMKLNNAMNSISAQISASPATIVQPDGTGLGIAEISWQAPNQVAVEVHVNSPNGPIFAASAGSGHARTEKWVKDGTEFYLQNVSIGKPLSADNTLATVKVRVSR